MSRFALLLLLFSQASFAQEAGTQASEVQIFYAPLISNTKGVDDTIPMGGMRLSSPFSLGHLEYTLAAGAAHGVSYQIFAFDYRVTWQTGFIDIFGTIGLNFDYYKPKPTEEENRAKFGNGFHFAGGLIIPIAATTTLRADFQQRYGPGRSLWVMVGPAIQF